MSVRNNHNVIVIQYCAALTPSSKCSCQLADHFAMGGTGEHASKHVSQVKQNDTFVWALLIFRGWTPL